MFSPEEPWPGTYDGRADRQPLPDHLLEFSMRTTEARYFLEGSVQYDVRVNLPNLGSDWTNLWIGNANSSVSIPVINLKRKQSQQRVQWHSLSFNTEIRSLRLLPSHSDGHLTFRERTKSIFQRDELPSLNLKLTVMAPQTIYFGFPAIETLPFKIHITSPSINPPATNQGTLAIDEKSNTTTSALEKLGDLRLTSNSPPTLTAHLTSFTLSLLSHTHVRAYPLGSVYYSGQATGHQDLPLCEYRHNAKNPKIEVPINSATPTAASSYLWFDFSKALNITHARLHDLVIEGDVVPDFATPNLARKYFLQWDMRFEVAGEEVRWESGKGETGLMRIYVQRGGRGEDGFAGAGMSGKMGGREVGAASGGFGGGFSGATGGEEQLPRYEEVSGLVGDAGLGQMGDHKYSATK